MIIAVFDVQRVGAHLTIIVVFETILQDKNKDWNWLSTQVLILQVLVLVFFYSC